MNTPSGNEPFVTSSALPRGWASRSSPNRLLPESLFLSSSADTSHTTKEIAALLHRSEKTIEGSRARFMQQLNIHDVAGFVRSAIRIGLIPADR